MALFDRNHGPAAQSDRKFTYRRRKHRLVRTRRTAPEKFGHALYLVKVAELLELVDISEDSFICLSARNIQDGI